MMIVHERGEESFHHLYHYNDRKLNVNPCAAQWILN